MDVIHHGIESVESVDMIEMGPLRYLKPIDGLPDPKALYHSPHSHRQLLNKFLCMSFVFEIFSTY